MPSDRGGLDEWYAYNRHEFSPYANAARGSRSVVVFRVLGDLFEKDTKHGRYQHVPALIYAGHGCTGTDYTKYHEYAPVQLSTIDAEKWDYDTGDTVVLIGGQSRSSRIFRIPEDHATVLAETHLHYETGDREEALAYLDAHGYDTGHNPTRSHSATTKPERTSANEVWDSTTAAALERRAERDGINTLTHRERRRIAFRLLKRGWQYAWDWFEEQYGTDFDPTITHQQLADCIRAFPDDYDHITIPK